VKFLLRQTLKKNELNFHPNFATSAKKIKKPKRKHWYEIDLKFEI
jgi:hypothetical protein